MKYLSIISIIFNLIAIISLLYARYQINNGLNILRNSNTKQKTISRRQKIRDILFDMRQAIEIENSKNSTIH